MNRFIVIGLGSFGATLATRLYALGHEVIAIDTDPAHVDAIGPHVTRALVGDATQRDVLREAGAEGANTGIVSIGENLGASTLALLALRDVGIQDVFVKVTSDDHARIAQALGATDMVYPEREAALNLASRITSARLLQYTAYGDRFGIQEMPIPKVWVGKTLVELRIDELGVQVVAIHDQSQDAYSVPKAGEPLHDSTSLLIAGSPEQLERLAKLR